MIAFATEWLVSLYGADVKKAIGRTQATRWNTGALGARRFLGRAPSAASRGASADGADPRPAVFRRRPARDAFLHGRRRRESGERAADAALKLWVRSR